MPSIAARRHFPPDLAIGGLFLLTALLVYQGPLFGGNALYFRDLQIFFAPMKHFLGSALREGYLPWWNPSLQMGAPFFADPQSGVFYPPSLIFAVFDAPRGIAISLALHLVVGQAGAYALARRNGFERLPSAATGLVYGLGGWSLSCSNMLTLAHSAAWAPWTILVCEQLWRRPDRRGIALAAIVLAMQMYSGWPEMFILLAVVLLVRRLFTAGIGNKRWLPATLAAGLLAAGLFAPQFLATWEAYRASARVGGMRVEELLEFSATGAQWLSLLRPPALSAVNWNILDAYPDGHVPIFLTLHLGWLALPLIALGATMPRRYSLSWLAIGAIGIFFALGAANPLAVEILKQINRFRTPEKYLFLAHLAAAMLVAPGLARLLAWTPTKLAPSAATILLLVLAGELVLSGRKIDLLAPAGYYRLEQTAEARIIGREPGRIYARSVAQENTDTVRELYAAFRDSLTPNIGQVAGMDYVNGVSFLQYREHLPVLELIEGLPASELLARRLAFLGVRYVVTDDPSFATSREWSLHAQRLTPRLWRLGITAPLLGFAHHVTTASDDTVAGSASNIDFANGNRVFVTSPKANANYDTSAQILELRKRPGLYEISVAANGSAWLVLRENRYPGWTATLDGSPIEIVPTNRFFMGLPIPPGQHRVRIEFRPTQLTPGLFVAALAAAALLAMIFLARTNPVRRSTTTA